MVALLLLQAPVRAVVPTIAGTDTNCTFSLRHGLKKDGAGTPMLRLVGEFAVQSPLARFSMLGRADGAVLARLLRPHIDGVVGKLKRTKHFGRVVAVARGAAVALPKPKAPRRPKKKPLPKWNASSIKRDPRGVARHCLRGTRKRCFCVECWSTK